MKQSSGFAIIGIVAVIFLFAAAGTGLYIWHNRSARFIVNPTPAKPTVRAMSVSDNGMSNWKTAKLVGWGKPYYTIKYPPTLSGPTGPGGGTCFSNSSSPCVIGVDYINKIDNPTDQPLADFVNSQVSGSLESFEVPDDVSLMVVSNKELTIAGLPAIRSRVKAATGQVFLQYLVVEGHVDSINVDNLFRIVDNAISQVSEQQFDQIVMSLAVER